MTGMIKRALLSMALLSLIVLGITPTVFAEGDTGFISVNSYAEGDTGF